MIAKDSLAQNQLIRNYYQFQSSIYDATRWAFLFGRREIMDHFGFDQAPEHLVEVGCGTGINVVQLRRQFPEARITGIDVSADMLAKARQKLSQHDRVTLLEQAYGVGPSDFPKAPDLFLFSYALTMINPQYADLIRQAHADLRPGGRIAVVDFHSCSVAWFKQHMENHHVRMDGHLDPVLEQYFEPRYSEVRKAYGGLWNYFLFVGEKKAG